ncbi:type II toxin-antitoxin system VapC family toxin [Fulvivirga sp. M361]|uniref:type II toxin-antitoxin system VapC family toxin n=1 Tax=Fulvivirga sp. M361 TaxID=2594266 RepID=UPI00117BD294|nr:type II toxin-antitoxin system VapC family toxin [Fulvivirga sp. M361]TRX60049.1 type II toxin-antitoxin system VapC family toxin [Fulvivirga sp. M361]
MEEGQLILCDTNIIIEFYKENPVILNILQTIGQSNIALSIITMGELLYGALNKNELKLIRRDIDHLHVKHITPAIGERFIALMEQYALSHKLSLPDGLIAATALEENIPLYTLNQKDFKYIKGLRLYK